MPHFCSFILSPLFHITAHYIHKIKTSWQGAAKAQRLMKCFVLDAAADDAAADDSAESQAHFYKKRSRYI